MVVTRRAVYWTLCASAAATSLAVGCGDGTKDTYLGGPMTSGGSPAGGGDPASGGHATTDGGASSGGPSEPDGGEVSAGGSTSGGVAGSTSGASGASGVTGEAGQGGAAGVGDMLFREDFEDGNLDGWGTGPASIAYAITDTTAAGGSELSLMKAYSGAGGPYAGPNYQFPAGLEPSRVSFWIHLAQNTGAVYVALSSDLDAIDHFFVIGLGRYYLDGCGPAPSIPIADGWYPVEIAFNWDNNTFRCSFNGAPLSGSPLQAATGPIRRLDLFDASDSATLTAWDEIVFYR